MYSNPILNKVFTQSTILTNLFPSFLPSTMTGIPTGHIPLSLTGCCNSLEAFCGGDVFLTFRGHWLLLDTCG
jgi:hypothetical protein